MVSLRSLPSVAVVIFSAVASLAANESRRPDTRFVTDNLGRRIVLPARVTRVLSLQPEITRLIAALGAADRLAGIDFFLRHYDPFFGLIFPGQARLPVVSMADYNFNPEAVALLAPDIIFGAPEDKAVVEALQKKTGVPTLALSSLGRFERLLFELSLLGEVLDRRERAAELESLISGRIARIREKTSALPASLRPRVYLSFWGLATQTPVFYEPVNAAGGINVAERLAPSFPETIAALIDLERLIAWNPDIILVHGNYPPRFRKVTSATFLADPRLAGVKAVRDGRVFYIFGFWNWWDPAQAVLDTVLLAHLFHPSLFPDFDMKKETDAIFRAFYGLDRGFDALSGILDCRTWFDEHP